MTAFCQIVRKFAAKKKNCRIKMKRILEVSVLSMMVCLLFSSCLKSEETEVILYNDAAITTFTLGTLTQTNPKTGKTASINGSVYKMAIDQLNCRIYNSDSLPLGTDVTSVLATVAAKNGGGIAIRTLSDSTLLEWYSSTKAIDFSSPRVFRVFASDGSYYRDYKVTLNVKKTSSDDFWTAQSDSTLFGSYTKVRMLALDTMLVALGSTGSATQVCLSSDKGKTWTRQSQEFDVSAGENAQVCGSSLFVLSNNQLYSSKNAVDWVSVPNSWDLSQLVATDTRSLFAITSAHELKAAFIDDLNTWTTEQIEEGMPDSVATQLLTLQDISYVSFAYTAMPYTDYVLMVGNDGSQTVVWRKISQYGDGSHGGKWVNIPAESVNHYLLPKHTPLSLVYIDNKVWAMGNNGTSVYQSSDQGISWRSNTDYILPLAMSSVTADSDGVLWGISLNEGKGKIWRGKTY